MLKVRIRLLLGIVILLSVGGLVAAPAAQHYMEVHAKPFEMGDHGYISYPVTRMDLKNAAEWLARQLSKDDRRWQIVAGDDGSQRQPAIQLSLLGSNVDVPYPRTDKRFGEAYSIDIGEVVKIRSGGSAGAMYAVRRLVELLGENKTLKAVTVTDYPEYKWRGVDISLKSISCGDPLVLKPAAERIWLDCMSDQMEKWSSMRINLLSLNSPIFYRSNDADIRLLNKLFDRARQLNIEPIPVLPSKLWGIPNNLINVNAIEGKYHKQVKFSAYGGKLEPEQGSPNLVRNGGWVLGDKIPASALISRIGKANALKPADNVAIERSERSRPWEMTAVLTDAQLNSRIPVEPGKYYELTFETKSDRKRASQVWIGFEEYDRNRRSIQNLHRDPVKLFTDNKTQRRWIPIFTSSSTHAISLRFTVKNIADKTGRITLSSPGLYSMEGQLVNVLVNKETEPVITSQDGVKMYVNGRDYELRPAPVREWRNVGFSDIGRTQISLLPGSRIAGNEVVSLSYDSLPLEYRAIPRSKYSAASSYTYGEYARIFGQLEKLAPEFIHLSMDEHAGGLNRDSRSLGLKISNRELLITYINTLDSMLHSTGTVYLPNGKNMPGLGWKNTQLIVWDDMLNPWHNGGKPLYEVPFGGIEGGTALVAGQDTISLRRSILLSSWWYSADDRFGVVKNTPAFYKRNGYRYFVSTWYQKGGIARWLDAVNPDDVEGFIATTWNGNMQGVPIIACAGWNSKAGIHCSE